MWCPWLVIAWCRGYGLHYLQCIIICALQVPDYTLLYHQHRTVCPIYSHFCSIPYRVMPRETWMGVLLHGHRTPHWWCHLPQLSSRSWCSLPAIWILKPLLPSLISVASRTALSLVCWFLMWKLGVLRHRPHMFYPSCASLTNIPRHSVAHFHQER
jgi:hypothetical protein